MILLAILVGLSLLSVLLLVLVERHQEPPEVEEPLEDSWNWPERKARRLP